MAYVYALNTNIRTIGGETVGVADFRYKEHTTAFQGEELNQKLYNKLCKRRAAYFESNPLPTLITISDINKVDSMVDGYEVYICPGAVFDDYKVKTKVGVLRKEGNRWTIDYLPNGKKLIEIQKQADAAKAASNFE